MKNAFGIKNPKIKGYVMNALSIFEKHLGNTLGAGEQKNLAKNIKDINQAIGSLQTIDSTLKKALQNLQNFQEFSQNLECSFMGENLINKEITLLLFGQTQSFFIQDFSTLSQEYSQEELENYLTQKRAEISSILDWVMEEMEQTPTQSTFSPSMGYGLQSGIYKI